MHGFGIAFGVLSVGALIIALVPARNPNYQAWWDKVLFVVATCCAFASGAMIVGS